MGVLLMKRVFLSIFLSYLLVGSILAQEDSPITKLEQKLQIVTDSLGANHLEIATISDRLAQSYLSIGQFSKADQLFTTALNVKTKQSDIDLLSIADSYHNIGRIKMYQANFEEANNLFHIALEIRLNRLEENHLDIATSYYAIGNAYWRLSAYDKARDYYQSALDIRRKELDENHLDVAVSYNSLGNIFWETGKYDEADEYFNKALNIRLKHLDASPLDVAESYNTLGGFYATIGNYSKAINFYNQALKINIEELGERAYFVAYIYNNLGIFYKDLGDYEKAKYYCDQSLDIVIDIFGESHPSLTSTYYNLGLIHLDLNEYQKAKSFFNTALDIKLNAYGPQHPDIAYDYNNLGIIFQEEGDFNKAIEYYNKALQINQKSFDGNHPDIAFTYNNLGMAYQENGDYQKAINYFNNALDINLETFGENHRDIIHSYTELASTYELMNQYESADSIWHEFIPQNMNRLRSNYLFLPNEQRTKYSNTFSTINTNFYSFAVQSKSQSTKQLATNYLLNTKSLALDYGVSTNQLIKEINDSTLTNQHEKLFRLNKQLADVEILTAEEQKAKGLSLLDLQENYAELTSQILRHPQLKEKLETENIGWHDIRKRLTSNEAAIDFLRLYERENRTWVYYGIVIRDDFSNPKFVRLANERTLSSFLSSSQILQPEYIATSKQRKALHEAVWAPFKPYLNGVSKIHLSPTSLLHRLPFESLQNEKNGYLASEYEFHYYSALRDVLNKKPSKNKYEDIVLMGHILYDPNDKDAYLKEEFDLAQADLRAGMKPIPKTLNEVREIHKTAELSGLKSTMLTIDAASEDTIQFFVGDHAPNILHIATHGVFLPPLEQDHSDELIGSRLRLRSADNPLQRSALMLYGANESWTKGQRILGSSEDGILTALEVTALNLQNTDMVVLSACSTGLGEAHINEGIFGLQRAFKLAGVEYIVASLWDVNDVASKDLMVLFYDHLLLKNQSPAIALRNAKLEMKNKGAKPEHWAGFILIE